MGKNIFKMKLEMEDGSLKIFEVQYGKDKYTLGGEMTIENKVLSIKGFSIDGNSTNKLGVTGTRDFINLLGKDMGVKEVYIIGSPRTTGANPGKISTYQHVVK